jgi:hypothetical protein
MSLSFVAVIGWPSRLIGSSQGQVLELEESDSLFDSDLLSDFDPLSDLLSEVD